MLRFLLLLTPTPSYSSTKTITHNSVSYRNTPPSTTRAPRNLRLMAGAPRDTLYVILPPVSFPSSSNPPNYASVPPLTAMSRPRLYFALKDLGTDSFLAVLWRGILDGHRVRGGQHFSLIKSLYPGSHDAESSCTFSY